MSKTEKMSNTRKLNDMGQYVVSMANMLGSMLQKTEKATDIGLVDSVETLMDSSMAFV